MLSYLHPKVKEIHKAFFHTHLAIGNKTKYNTLIPHKKGAYMPVKKS